MLNLATIRLYVVPDVGTDFSKYGYAIGFILLSLAFSLIIGKLRPKNPNIKFISRFFMWTSIAALTVYTFRYENVKYFNSNLWIMLIAIAYIVGIFWSLVNHFRIKPIVDEQIQKINEYQKYLPKSKKKKVR